jgi:4'-phosphopantetheinyl transferase
MNAIMKTEIVFTQITDNDIQNIELFMPFIDEKRRNQLNKYRFDIDKALSLYAEIIVRQNICKTFKILNNDIIFEFNQYNKPFLKIYKDFYFNISHTHSTIAIAFSDGEIGIDIEKICYKESQIAMKLFTMQEREYVLSSNNRCVAFYEIWTRKEAYIKYLGKGLSIPLDSFDTLSENIKRKTNTVMLYNNVISVCGDFIYEKPLFDKISKINLNNINYFEMDKKAD